MRGRALVSIFCICATMLAGCGGSKTQPPLPLPPALAGQSSSSYKIVYSFKGNRDGYGPTGNLLALSGVLYGVTYLGGNEYGSLGTIYKLSKFGKERVIYRFAGGADGSNPYNSGLVDVNGAFYGTTQNGGNGCAGGCGTIFTTNADGVEQVLYGFRGGSDGVAPSAPLVAVNGVLYGTTQSGGTSGCRGYGCGIVFRIDPSGSRYRVLHRFAGGSDGASPFGGLLDVNGKLYGTTSGGGSTYCKYGCGTVFEVSTSGAERVLYAFKGGRDGASPDTGLIAANGLLYGTTVIGGTAHCGSSRCGTVFEVSTSGAERVIYRFNGGVSDGASPQTPLLYSNGTLYGTTGSGGLCYESRTGCGTVFALYAPGTEKILHTFVGDSDGAFPTSGLVEFNGWFYGTTLTGGSTNCGGSGCGTIFKLAPADRDVGGR